MVDSFAGLFDPICWQATKEKTVPVMISVFNNFIFVDLIYNYNYYFRSGKLVKIIMQAFNKPVRLIPDSEMLFVLS